jgi:hypothetical protein
MSAIDLPGLWTPPKPHVWTRPKWWPALWQRFSAYHGSAKCRCCATCTFSTGAVEVDLDMSARVFCTACMYMGGVSNSIKWTSSPDPSGVYVLPYVRNVGLNCQYELFVTDTGLTADQYATNACGGGITPKTSVQLYLVVTLAPSPTRVLGIRVFYVFTENVSSGLIAVAFDAGTASLGATINNLNTCGAGGDGLYSGGTAVVTAA